MPLIVSKSIDAHLPFSAALPFSAPRHSVQWGNFTARVREYDLTRGGDVAARLSAQLDALRPRLPRLRAAMAAAAPDVLYDVEGSRVADNLLHTWAAKCKQRGQAHPVNGPLRVGALGVAKVL